MVTMAKYYTLRIFSSCFVMCINLTVYFDTFLFCRIVSFVAFYFEIFVMFAVSISYNAS